MNADPAEFSLPYELPSAVPGLPAMHPQFDDRLTDPTEAAVSHLLKRACSAVNGKRKTGIIGYTDSEGKTLARRVLAEPQGHFDRRGNRSATDTARFVLAWWTAPGSRKLVRVRAWREPWREYQVDYDHPSRVAHRDFESRPAVWHLDPERVTIVEADGESQWVAVCGCGAVGTPESLAWAGGMCGPCRDRVEEHGLDSVSHEPGLLTADEFTPVRMTFTPDGTRVVAVGGNAFRAWDRATGSLLAGGRGLGRNSLDVVSPDGRHVLLYEENGWLCCRDVESSRRQVATLDSTDILGIHWIGRPGEWLLQRWHGHTLSNIRVEDDGETRVIAPISPPVGEARLHAIHPDPGSPRAVFSENGNVAVCGVGRTGELATLHWFRLGSGQLDRTGNWTAGPELVRFTADGERLLFVYGQQMELWNPAKPKALLQAAFPTRIRDARFSPDGEHLFVLGEDGSVFVCHPGLLTHVRARLRWHVGPVHSLAVSADSTTLATAGVEGVKLWPVARLLDGLQ